MLNWLYAKDSQSAEDLRNELLTSTTLKLGVKLRYEFQSSSRRQKGIEEELSRRIRLMEKIPDSHPYEIFVYNDKGFKSFTSKVKEILGRDLERKPQKVAVPKYLDYTRGMLKDEIEKEKKAQPISKEVAKDQEGDEQLKEEYEQLVEEFGAMESEHEQLREKYQQLRKDHVQLQKEHERVLQELSERKLMQAKAPEQKTASAPDMRPRDEGIKQDPVPGGKISPPGIHQQARQAVEAREARERANAQAREREAPKQEEAKTREWEEENFVREIEKRERELREERAAHEHQQMRAPPKDSTGTGSLDVKAEGSAPQVPRHSIHGGVFDSQPPPQTMKQKELSQGQKIGYASMQQYLPYQPKHASLRQVNESKSVSFDLPTKTPNNDQEPPAEQKSNPRQQTDSLRSLSAGHSTGTPIRGQIFPAQRLPSQPLPAEQPPVQQPPVQQPPVQQPPVQRFPVQQRSAGLQQANDPRSFPNGLPTGTPDMGHMFPVQQRSAPLQQTNESREAPFCLPITTAPTPTDMRVPTLSSQIGHQLGIFRRSQEPLRSQEPGKSANFDQGRAVLRIDEEPFIRRPEAP